VSATPKRMTTGPRPGRRSWEVLRFIGPTLLLACTVVFGFTYFLLVYLPAERKQAVEAWSARLSAMAEDRSTVVSFWIAESMRDAATLARNTGVGAALGKSGDAAGARVRLRPFLDWFGHTQGYLAAYILDTSGTVVAQTSGAPPIEAPGLDLVRRALTRGSAATDILALADGTPAVAFAVPVPPLTDPNDKAARGSPGVVVLEADPNEWLFPFLAKEPIPSSSGEVLLARSDRDEIVFLSPLRNNPARPLAFRVPVTKSLAARAVLEGRQVFQDVHDYRGVPVFAVGRPIASTSWLLVAKVDQHEALAGMRGEVRSNALLLAGAVLVVAGAVFGLWRARRARLETAVKQSEQRFALLRDHANDAMVFTRKDGRLYDVNRAAEVLYGYPREELIGLDMRKVLPEAARSVSIPRMDPGGDDKGVVFEVVHVHRDGTPFPVEVSSHRVEVDGEEMSLSIIRDITERKRAEETLRESEARYRALVLAANDAIVTADDAGCIVGWNLGAERMFGYAEAEVTRQSLTVLMPDRYRERHRDGMKRVVGGGRSSVVGTTVELEGIRKDGTEFPLELSLSQCEVNGAYLFTSIIRDITERKRAEETLRESVARYRALIDGSADGIVIAEIGTKTFKYANPALCRMLGYSADEMRTMGLADIHPKDAMQHVVAEFEAQARGDKTLATDIPCLRKDGSVIYADINAAKVTIDERPCNVGFFRDITERKRAEGALRESEERFRILFEQAADCIFLLEIGPEGIPVIRDANRATFRLLGYERDEVIGQPVSFIDAAPDASKVVAERRRNVLSGTGARFEVRHRCKDGTIRDFECSVTELQIGSKTFAVSVERDITERKQMEKALHEGEDRLRLLAENVSDVVWTMDLSGRFSYFSPSVERVFGYTPQEALQLRVEQMVTPGSLAAALQTMAEGIAQVRAGQPMQRGTLELEHRRKDGSTFWGELTFSGMYDSSGEFKGIVAAGRDITERKRVDQAKADFVSFATHQLRTPLSGIKWMLELASDGTAAAEDVKSYIGDAQASADRLIRVVNDLLDASRLEQGRIPVKLARLDLRELTRAVVDELSPLARARNQSLSFTEGSDPATVNADPQLLRQAILNLTSNAIKYTPQNGAITVTISREDSHVRWEVKDNGIGIPRDAQANLFEKFFRADNAVTISTEGTGVGLYLVRLIIDRLGGRAGCLSEVGKGSTFYFTLPFTE
jgi:PAS domain S-box-containing protein